MGMIRYSHAAVQVPRQTPNHLACYYNAAAAAYLAHDPLFNISVVAAGCSSLPTSGVPAADLGKYDRTACAGIMAGANCTVGCAGSNVLSPGTARTTFTCSIDSKTKKPVWDAKPKWPVCVRMYGKSIV
jgi:hypothetical protein